MIELFVNDTAYPAEVGETVLQVLRREDIDIPTLCYHEALKPYGACRLCMVEVIAGGRPGITASCSLPVAEGLTIKVDTPNISRMRKVLLEMYLGEAPESKQVRALAEKYGVTETRFNRADLSASGDRCILCGLCARVCNEALGMGAINYTGRGVKTQMSTPWHKASEACIGCGACAYVCPADAIDITDTKDERIMNTWRETALKVKICAKTNQRIATEKGLNEIYNRLPELPESLKSLSPEARRIHLASGMKLFSRKH